MTAIENVSTARMTNAAALDLFDSLDTVDVNFMLGCWRGEGFHTGHPLDGLLESYHWHGKRFDSSEEVHPLVFKQANGKTATLNPRVLGTSLSRIDWAQRLKHAWLGRLFQTIMPLFKTKSSRARLRLTTYRNKQSATMIYDQLPINDVFRKLDENTVLGAMDLKGLSVPLFFLLRRENPTDQ